MRLRLLNSALCGVLSTVIVVGICFVAIKTDTPPLALIACGPAATLVFVVGTRLRLDGTGVLVVAAGFISSLAVQYASYCFLVLSRFKRKGLVLLLVLLFHVACSVFTSTS